MSDLKFRLRETLTTKLKPYFEGTIPHEIFDEIEKDIDKEEEYNGWTNHETWALNLWLTNEEGIYHYIQGAIKEAPNGFEAEDRLKNIVEDWQEDCFDNEKNSTCTKEMKSMFKDVGSLWRVNYREIVESFLEE